MDWCIGTERRMVWQVEREPSRSVHTGWWTPWRLPDEMIDPARDKFAMPAPVLANAFVVVLCWPGMQAHVAGIFPDRGVLYEPLLPSLQTVKALLGLQEALSEISEYIVDHIDNWLGRTLAYPGTRVLEEMRSPFDRLGPTSIGVRGLRGRYHEFFLQVTSSAGTSSGERVIPSRSSSPSAAWTCR